MNAIIKRIAIYCFKELMHGLKRMLARGGDIYVVDIGCCRHRVEKVLERVCERGGGRDRFGDGSLIFYKIPRYMCIKQFKSNLTLF